MSKRSNILSNIKTTLEGIVAIKHVEIDKFDPVDLSTLPLPAAFVYSGKDTLSESNDRKDAPVIGMETWSWEIFIEIWAKEADMETLLSSIHTAMHSDYKRGGYAEYSVRTSVEMYVVDPTRAVRSMLLAYRVIYRHSLGSS